MNNLTSDFQQIFNPFDSSIEHSISFYLGTRNTPSKYHWIEMDRGDYLEILEIMETSIGTFCCVERSDTFHRSKIYFTISVSYQLGWLRCFFQNIDYLHKHFEPFGISIEVVLAYYYEDENLDYILALFDVIEQFSFPIHYNLYNGKFSRAGGLYYAAMQPFINKDDILILSDLHLEIPIQFIVESLKFVASGQQFYVPMVIRLGYKHSLANWYLPKRTEREGFGIIALTQQDFIGLNISSYYIERTVHGAEDWHFIEKAAALGYRFIRTVPDRYVHYYHSRNRLSSWYEGLYKPTKKTKPKKNKFMT